MGLNIGCGALFCGFKHRMWSPVFVDLNIGCEALFRGFKHRM